MLKFLGSHLATAAMVAVYILLGVFVFGFGWGTIWYTLINTFVWMFRGIIANGVASYIEHKMGKELSKKDELLVRYAVCGIWIAVTVLVPLAFWLVVTFLAYIVNLCGEIGCTLADDITNQNGVGLLLFAIAELLLTLVGVIANCLLANQKNWVGVAVTVAVQSIISSIYYWGICFTSVFDIIVNALLFTLISLIALVVSKLLHR